MSGGELADIGEEANSKDVLANVPDTYMSVTQKYFFPPRTSLSSSVFRIKKSV